MNRRGFFGTLAAIAVVPLARNAPATRLTLDPVLDDAGGFLVPEEFTQVFLTARRLTVKLPLTQELLDDVVLDKPVITLRTIDGLEITRPLA